MFGNKKRTIEYTLIRSDRKSLAVQIKAGGQVVVRAPRRMSERDIVRFLEERKDWIISHVDKAVRDQKSGISLSEEDIKELTKQAKKVIPERVAYYAPKVGVEYGNITIRHQKTRWGSASSKGNLNFNCLLMLTPPEVLDSVVVHELCHLLEMNHSQRFYREVYRVYPDYDRCHRWLRTNGRKLMQG